MIKRALHASGALAAWHRRRNRDRLTVIMFHRVLDRADPRFATSDPEYTLPADLFAASLAFFRAHYHVVALDDVLAARAGERALPERPLLITFDDGWSDNEEYALPALRAAGLPATIFVVSEAVGRAQPFWQEQLITAWRAQRLSRARADALWRELTGGDPPFAMLGPDDLWAIRTLIEHLERLDHDARDRALAPLAAVLDDGVRHMITADQLRALARGRVAIGAHGQTHRPLTEVDAAAEVRAARRALEDQLGGTPVTTLSFPHGKHTDAVRDAVRAAGVRLQFTSVPELPAAHGTDDVLGRVGFTAETITDASGRFAPELLALHLFRKPHAR